MAGKKFSELNNATASQDDDLFAIAQDKGGGVLETRKLTAAMLYNAFRSKNDSRYARLAEAVHFLQTLDVSGAVALLDTLSVAGKSSLADLDVSGAVALLQMLTVGGDPLIKAKDAAKLSGGADADFDTVPKVDGVDLLPLWMDATYQDVTASRAINTNYTNTTGRAFVVKVSLERSAVNGELWADLRIDGVIVDYFSLTNVSTAIPRVSVSAIVPNGAVYRVDANSSFGNIFSWMELR